jgi:hypothetical protein
MLKAHELDYVCGTGSHTEIHVETENYSTSYRLDFNDHMEEVSGYLVDGQFYIDEKDWVVDPTRKTRLRGTWYFNGRSFEHY